MLVGENRDQAVDRRANGRSTATQGSIELAGTQVEVDARGFQKREIVEPSDQACAPLVLAQALEDLGDHHATGTDFMITQEEGSQGLPLWRRISVQKVHPDRGVDKNLQTSRPRT